MSEAQTTQHTVVVTGASSGLGLAFLKHYAAQPSTRVIGLNISPLPAPISSLQNLAFYEADVTSEESLARVTADLTGQAVHLRMTLIYPSPTQSFLETNFRHLLKIIHNNPHHLPVPPSLETNI